MGTLARGFLAALAVAAPAAAIDGVPLPARATPNGPVTAMTTAPDGTVYFGGSFTRVGQATGPAAVLSVATGRVIAGGPFVSASPSRPGGTVAAAVSDGAGGWYLGGDFIEIGGTRRRSLAHILADGRTDASFAPDPNGAVTTLVREGGRLFVAGSFTTISGVARGGAASYPAPPGVPGQLTSFDPKPLGGEISDVAVTGDDRVILAGEFTSVGGQPRSGLAAVSSTGTPLTFPTLSGGGAALAVAVDQSTDTLYVGGRFTSLGGVSRANLGRVALAGGSSAVDTWNPGPDQPVRAIAVSGASGGARVWVAGAFRRIDNAQRVGIARFDATGALTEAFDAGIGVTGFGVVTSIVVAGSPGSLVAAYEAVAQASASIQGQPLTGLVAIDATSGELARDQPPEPDGLVVALATSDSGASVLAGGRFGMLGGADRPGLAALDVAGDLAAWSPVSPPLATTTLEISDIEFTDGALYVAGNFTAAGTTQRRGGAAFDPRTGGLLPWNPDPGASALRDIEATADRVLLAGSFVTVGGEERRALAAVDRASGAALPWIAGVSGAGATVNALVVDGQTVYAAGDFANAGGRVRANLAALDLTTGALRDWQPSPDLPVEAMTTASGRLVIAGGFRSAGGSPRVGLAAFDMQTRQLLPLAVEVRAAAASTPVVSDLLSVGDTLVLAGKFDQVGGQPRSGLAGINLENATLLSWAPVAGFVGPSAVDSGTVSTLGRIGANVAVAGTFWRVGDVDRPYLAVFGGVLANIVPPQLSGVPRSGSTVRCIPGSWSGQPIAFNIQWLSDNVVIAGAGAAGYPVRVADVGHRLTCRVRAINPSGESSLAESPAAAVVSGIPSLRGRPTIAGASRVGVALKCKPGQWVAATGYRFAWRRNSRLIAGRERSLYRLRWNDVGSRVSCRVTAVSAGGEVSASTAGRLVRPSFAVPDLRGFIPARVARVRDALVIIRQREPAARLGVSGCVPARVQRSRPGIVALRAGADSMVLRFAAPGRRLVCVPARRTGVGVVVEIVTPSRGSHRASRAAVRLVISG